MSVSEYDHEPIRGLPGQLPPGERLLWQGSPSWRTLARSAYFVRPVAVYFALLALWQIGSAITGRHAWAASLRLTAWLLFLGVLAIGVLRLLAWLAARATVYSITTRRVVIRHGIALPMAMNIPLERIEAVDLQRRRDGSGELALRLQRPDRISYALNWPHVRRGRLAHPEPALRAIADAEQAGAVLTRALRDTAAA